MNWNTLPYLQTQQQPHKSKDTINKLFSWQHLGLKKDLDHSVTSSESQVFLCGSSNGARWYKWLHVQCLDPRASKCPHVWTGRAAGSPLLLVPWSAPQRLNLGKLFYYYWTPNFPLCCWGGSGCTHWHSCHLSETAVIPWDGDSAGPLLLFTAPAVLVQLAHQCPTGSRTSTLPKNTSPAAPGTEVPVLSLSNTLRSFHNSLQGKSPFAHRLCKEPKFGSVPSFPILSGAQFNCHI